MTDSAEITQAREKLLDAAQLLVTAGAMISEFGERVHTPLIFDGIDFAQGKALLAAQQVLGELLGQGEYPVDVIDAIHSSGLDVREAIDYCRTQTWATNEYVTVTVAFRVHSGTDPDAVRNTLANNLEHGSFREGITIALDSDNVGADFDGAWLPEVQT